MTSLFAIFPVASRLSVTNGRWGHSVFLRKTLLQFGASSNVGDGLSRKFHPTCPRSVMHKSSLNCFGDILRIGSPTQMSWINAYLVIAGMKCMSAFRPWMARVYKSGVGGVHFLEANANRAIPSGSGRGRPWPAFLRASFFKAGCKIPSESIGAKFVRWFSHHHGLATTHSLVKGNGYY